MAECDDIIFYSEIFKEIFVHRVSKIGVMYKIYTIGALVFNIMAYWDT